MSTRQKSFFHQEQKSKYRPRPQWNRTRSEIDVSRVASKPKSMTGAPIVASTQSRTKLKKFQFIDGAPAQPPMEHDGEDADKENDGDGIGTGDMDTATRPQGDVPQKSSETPRVGPSKTFPPSTPATRLPLADLIGNSDDALKHATTRNISPDEQLYWRNLQSPSSSSTVTPAPNKRGGKKRARSSSPPPSQLEQSAFFPAKEPLDMQGMEQTLKTPQADPAADLWNRYTVNTGNKGTPTASKGIAIANLINESSPHSSATAGSVSGLRRWASCGLEWPTSASKRRRTKGAFKEGQAGVEDVFGVRSTDGPLHGKSGLSKVGLLVERIQETMTKAPRPIKSSIPSSSSSLPDFSDFQAYPSGSPLQRMAVGRREAIENSPKPADNSRATQFASNPRENNAIEQPKPSSSSEYGDEEIDLDMVEAIEMASCAVQQSHSGPDAATSFKTAAQLQPPPKNSAAPEPMKDEFGSDDEFGLDDDDFFATDIENVISLYDNRPDLTPAIAQPKEPAVVGEQSLPPAKPPPIICDEASDDEFGGDDFDDEHFAVAEAMATQAPVGSTSSQHHSQRNVQAIQRYMVIRVGESQYSSARGHLFPEKILTVEEEKTKRKKSIILRQSWVETPCTTDSYVHVVGDFSADGQCIVDDCKNMLILHPDHLISATTVGDSFGCMRKAVLQDRVKATSRANAPMLYGTILHELFQESLKANRWDTIWLDECIAKILPSHLETILDIGETLESITEHLKSKLPELQSWAEVFVRTQPGSDAIVKDRNGTQAVMSINKLLDVEEHVWSPQYGLKGNIDATVQVVMRDQSGERVLTVPFEIKTGKATGSASHHAQTALYTLLLSDRYDIDIAYGILYYLESSGIKRIPAIRMEIIHMVMKRNELACYVRDRYTLPPMLKEAFMCRNCYAQDPCFIYNKLVEDGNGELLDQNAKEKFDQLVRGLTPADQEFMKKWETLLTKEESDGIKLRRELWTMLSAEREKLGRCFSKVILEPGTSQPEQREGTKINRFTYTFIKDKAPSGFSFTESELIVGEPIVISDEKGHFALAIGYVTNVRKRRITVAVDRRLHNARTRQPGFDPESNQVFPGIMEVSKRRAARNSQEADAESTMYRIDKDEFINGMAAVRNNLIQLMDDNVDRASNLRSLIVAGTAPVFKPSPSAYMLPTQSTLNSGQRAAIEKVMAAQDYALVLGMPGTGKTWTIAHIIRSLVARGKSVLLTSYTHSAVDNILLKIRNDKIDILRLGAVSRIHPDVRSFATLAVEPQETLEALEKSWMEPQVVATTCLTIGHPLFSRRTFDYCIVDEASQITLPTCLGPIRMAKTFVLVGDHYQLPPLVRNKEAVEGGLDVSLFRLLSEAHPEAVAMLDSQYRMSADIMSLSNELIYNGRLKCGDQDIARQVLNIPNQTALQSLHHHTETSSLPRICPGPTSSSCHLARTLEPCNRVLFLDTDPLGTDLETAQGSRITNDTEARLISQLAASLLAAGIRPADIGVVSFYRSQLALLRSYFHTAGSSASTQSSGFTLGAALGLGAVELSTADKFQGRDMDVVVVSFVRSNENSLLGDLLKDYRRINVALTRAKKKLVLVGSGKTLKTNVLLGKLVGICEERGWVHQLSEEGLKGHVLESSAFGLGMVTQKGRRIMPSPSPKKQGKSPEKKTTSQPESLSQPNRRVLGDVSSNPKAKTPRNSQGIKKPGNVAKLGRRGLLGSRPLLRDVLNDIM